MGKRWKWLLLIFSASVISSIVFGRYHREGPRYNGRTLLEWTKLSQTPEARDAIRAMGTNALPDLVKWIADEPAAWRKTPYRLPKKVPKWMVDESSDKRAELALKGFEILGTNASPALPGLLRLIGNTNAPMARSHAMEALTHLGNCAIPTLKRLLHESRNTRETGLLVDIRTMGTNAIPLVPAVIEHLGSTNLLHAGIAAGTLGILRLEPDLAVPALTASLTNAGVVRERAMISLSQFGSHARPALPALTNLLTDPHVSFRRLAAEVIEAINGKDQPIP